MKNTYTKYGYKIVKSGDVLEVYRYEQEQYKKMTSSEFEKEMEKQENRIEEEKERLLLHEEISLDESIYRRKKESIYRTKKNIRLLIDSNIHQYKERDKFITLTFENNPDRTELLYCFKKFNMRLKYEYPNIDYKYLAVMERGTRGQKKLHLHVLFFDLPFIPAKKFREIWKYGHVKMNAVAKYSDLSDYLTKYVTKILDDTLTIGKGQKFYFSSRGLKKPMSYFLTDEEFQAYMDMMNEYNFIYSFNFESKYVGGFEYMKFIKPYEFQEVDYIGDGD